MLTYDKLKHAIHDGMTSRGYNPNPADLHTIATKVMDLSKEPEVKEAAEEESERPSKPPRR